MEYFFRSLIEEAQVCSWDIISCIPNHSSTEQVKTSSVGDSDGVNYIRKKLIKVFRFHRDILHVLLF